MMAGLVPWNLFMFRTKHPPGLYVLFFTEMWERFSFYCMNAVFMLYMTSTTNGHPFLQRHASIINGLYFGMAYFLPFFGGLLADQKWGYRLTIILGALTMGMGHLFLAVDELPFFFAGLIALAIGNGLFKPNISTLVGKLYAPNDPRLDSAFTIFYMGINIGAFTSPIVAAYLKERYGFHTAFGAAGIGMGICICIFMSCRRWLVFANPQPGGDGLADRTVTAPAAVQRQRHMALVIIFVLVIFFWMAFNQGGNTFPQWFRDNTDRTPAAWWPHLPFLLDAEGNFSAALSSAINPFFVIAFSPLMVLLWSGLRRGSLEPSTPAKMGLGMLLTAVAFAILMQGALHGGNTPGVLVSPGYLVGSTAVITVAELCLSPMGLSLVSKLAAPSQRAAWMGGWFAATAAGSLLSGLIGHYWTTWKHSTFFGFLVGSSLFAGLLLLLCYRRLQAAMDTLAPAVTAPERAPAANDRHTSEAVTTGARFSVTEAPRKPLP